MTTVLVTGASRGLGLEFVRQYANDGAGIVACVRNPAASPALNELAKSAQGAITVFELDVGSGISLENFKARLGARPIDILINNAGVYGGNAQELGKIDYAGWLDTLNINTLGPIRVLEALQGNLAAGHDRKIIAISSAMGSNDRHTGNALLYRSSKAALNNAIKGASIALKPAGMIVVVVHPGWVRTDMGGPTATLAADHAVASMRNLVARLCPADSGSFFNYDGDEIPW